MLFGGDNAKIKKSDQLQSTINSTKIAAEHNQ